QFSTEDARMLRRELPGVSLLSEVSTASRVAREGARSARLTVYGVDPDYAALAGIEVAHGGRFINHRDMAERRRVAVIGNTAATELFETDDVVGRNIELGGSRYRIVGVLRPREGSAGFLNDRRVFTPATAYHIVSGSRALTSIIFAPAVPELRPQMVVRAIALLAARHGF